MIRQCLHTGRCRRHTDVNICECINTKGCAPRTIPQRTGSTLQLHRNRRTHNIAQGTCTEFGIRHCYTGRRNRLTLNLTFSLTLNKYRHHSIYCILIVILEWNLWNFLNIACNIPGSWCQTVWKVPTLQYVRKETPHSASPWIIKLSALLYWHYILPLFKQLT